MKKIIFILCFFLTGFWSMAQIPSGKHANIFLKNGIKIKGAIVGSFDENMLSVFTGNEEPLVLRYSTIKRITFKGYGTLQDSIGTYIAQTPRLKIKKYYHEIHGGLLIGDENTSVSVQTINGYQFNQYLGTGLGLGLNKYGNYLTLPIYARVKGYLFNRKVSPFYFADVGYGIAWKDNANQDIFNVEKVNGGLYWQAGIGYQVNFYNSAMLFSLGYINQDSKTEYVYYRPWAIDDVQVSEHRILRRFNLTIGFLF